MPDVRVKELSYAEAVNRALRRALDEFPESLLFGEDVAKPGGVFGVTKGLRRQFGERVFDTPISESVILGGALGAAMMGRRPIVEIMWADFFLVALDQLVNQIANTRYVSRGELTAPLTIRTQQGALPGSCAQHSQCLEAFFAHIPGVLVAMPATPQDAYDILLDAVRCDDPVVVVENRGLYHTLRADVRLDGAVTGDRKAAVRRRGGDITVVTWGAIQHQVLVAAQELAAAGVEAEVIDLRWLRPFDTTTVAESVGRTGRLLVVHEANVSSGFGAEVVSRVVEAGAALEVPPVRLGVNDLRMPAAPSLQAAAVPNVNSIVVAGQRLAQPVGTSA
ncbi:alpha-ketoacid dehydrogenase subunit beta [Micromonospora sp. NPDC048830]|uniref:alpha-ketoacid dehydrogenase subunit beta n=1 Tax=Micromonospora sp. NPDC048830 TaxID=3364257 RepID=UPI003723F098